jgi:hypothetical protein
MKIDLRDQYETKNSYGTKMKPLNKLRDHLYNLAYYLNATTNGNRIKISLIIM